MPDTFPQVSKGDKIVFSASLENKVRDLVNRGGRYGAGVIPGNVHSPQWILCYNAGSFGIKAGSAVNIKWDATGEDATAAQNEGMVCVKLYDTLEEQIGVARDFIGVGEFGMVAFHGVVKASLGIGEEMVQGGRYWPGYLGDFQLAEVGFLFVSRELIDLDSGNQYGCLKVYAYKSVTSGCLHFVTGVARRPDGAYPVGDGGIAFRNGGTNYFKVKLHHYGDVFFLPCRESISGRLDVNDYGYGSYVNPIVGGSRAERVIEGNYRMLWKYGDEFLAFIDDSPHIDVDSKDFYLVPSRIRNSNSNLCSYYLAETSVTFYNCTCLYRDKYKVKNQNDVPMTLYILGMSTSAGNYTIPFDSIDGSCTIFACMSSDSAAGSRSVYVRRSEKIPAGNWRKVAIATIYIDKDRDNDVSVIVWPTIPLFDFT